MRSVQRTEWIGENVGPIDWSYNFRSHFDSMCSNDARRDEACEQAKVVLRKIQEAFERGDEVRVTTDGGCPKFGYNLLIDVGMYDGWPYWRPVPSVFTRGPLGGEWHSFSMITDYRIRNSTPESGETM